MKISMLKIVVSFFFVLVLTNSLFVSASDEVEIFKKKHESFVKSYIDKLSENWDVEQVSDLSTPYFLSHIATANGQYVLRMYSALGRLEEIRDVKVSEHEAPESEKIYIFKLKALFEKGTTLVSVAVQKKNNTVKVHGINMERLSDKEWEE